MARRSIAHVDMDAFFAAVEVRDNPQLAGRPLLVGYPGKRGVVAAASYEARPYGCHSALPMAVALRRCPDATVVRPRFDRYLAASREVFAIFARYTPLVEGLSIDEAFLDLTGTERLHGPARRVGEAIRAAVRSELGLTCSVGLASCKFIAKIASERDKPDGLTEVPHGDERSFLRPMPVRELWGVGPRTEAVLRELGVRTVGELAARERGTLERALGEHGRHLHVLSHGIDQRPVDPDRGRRQVSHETTFHEDLRTRAELERWLLRHATRVADRLVAAGQCGRKVHIKLRETGFTTWTRQCTLDQPTAQTREIFEHARELLGRLEAEGVLRGRRFRLVGVGVSELIEASRVGVATAPAQLSLLDDGSEAAAEQAQAERARGRAVQGVMSEVRRRFGGRALFPAGADEEP